MTALSPARAAALAAVSDARQRAGRIRDIVRTSSDGGESGLSWRLAIGAVAAQDVLDEVIRARVKRASSLEPRVMDALRVAAFELLYLDTPAEVAVSQGVELVRSVSPRAAGLANAVLRRISAEIVVDGSDLRLVSGLPAWLLERIAADRGEEAAAALARCNLEPAPVYAFAQDVVQLAPFAPAETDLADVYKLREPAELYGSGLVQDGVVVVSDLSAQRVCARVAELAGAGDLLEVGQGSGTKSLIIARRCPSQITAVDVLASKVRTASARIARAGLGDRVTALAFDGTRLAETDLPPELDRCFDTVFVDAPCSGTGTMRRHPEIASKLTAEQITELAKLQAALLAAASARVAPGGYLVYSTCSVLAEENEQVIDASLSANSHFSRIEPDFQSIPGSGQADGHFCAVLRRN